MERWITPLRRFCLPGAVIAALGLGAMAAYGDPEDAGAGTSAADSDSATIWCYDRERALVRRMSRYDCRGEVVDEATARRVRERRIRLIQRKLEPAVPVVPGKRLRGTGSGFFVSAVGHVITNYHVVRGCKAVTVTPAGGEAIIVAVVAVDRPHDLALLKAPVAPRKTAVFRKRPSMLPGESLTVVGYPLLGRVTIRPILKTGHVYIGRGPSRRHLFALKIDIRPGNSGSPVLDDTGRVMGVVTADVDTPRVYQLTGRVIRDVGLGIRDTTVVRFMRRNKVPFVEEDRDERLTSTEQLDHAWKFVGQVGCWR